jgi:hypothetical protein
MNINNMYKDLSDEAKARFREWARNNHKPGDDISSALHPIVRDECRLMDEEFAGSKVAKILKVDFLEHRKDNEN